MCRSDPTLATFFWRDAMPTSRAYSDHECVIWEELDAWARSRMLIMEDLKVLVSFTNVQFSLVIGKAGSKTRKVC